MGAEEDMVAAIVAKREGKPKPRKKAAKKPPAKIGRPRKYTEAMLDEVLLSAAKGATWTAIGEACGIDDATAQDWCNPDHPTYCAAFHGAVTRAKNKADDVALSSLYGRATGYEYEEETATNSGRVVSVKKRMHSETAASKSWLANRIGWRGETSRVEADDPLLGILAAMRGRDDTPAVPEAD